jgi:hypothetical protein
MIELLNPLFFAVGAVAAVMVPLILHLIQARRTVRLPFSTIRFLQLAQRRSSQRIRMENLLLWLLRTLLLLALALAFAMPMLRNRAFGDWFGRSSRDIGIVIDGSYSMAYNLGRGTAWDRAIEQAVALIEGLSEQDRFCIFVARDRVDPVIEQLSSDREEALRRLRGLKFGQTSSQLAPALADANSALMESTEKRERELHLITDGQALPWRSFGEAEAAKPAAAVPPANATAATGATAAAIGAWDPAKADERVTCFVSLIGATAPENRTVVDVEIEPSLIVAGAAAKVSVRLGYTGPVGDSAATLFVDDREVANRSVTVTEEGGPELSFLVPPLAKGRHAGRIELPTDNLALDNDFHFILRVEDRVPVLAVGGREDLLFLRAALSAGGGKGTINAEYIEPKDLAGEKLEDFTCVFLCNAIPLSATEVRALEQFVEAGGLLVLFPGNRGTPADYAGWRVLPGRPVALREVPLSRRKQILGWLLPGHPILKDLDPGSTPPEVAVQRALSWEQLDPQAEKLVAHGDQPFLLGRPAGRGYVLQFAVSADRGWSDLPLSPYFLPILHQVVRFSAGVRGLAPYVWCTPQLPLEAYLPGATVDSVLQGPANRRVPVRSTLVEGRTSLYVEDLTEAGLYRMAAAGGDAPAPALAVNMVREESQLAPLETDDLPARLGLKNVQVVRSVEELKAQVEESRVGRTFGEHLLWLALLLAILEFFYANFLVRSAPTLSERLTIEASGKVSESAPAAAAPPADEGGAA